MVSSRQSTCNTPRGLTLIELLVVVAIIAIALSLGVPSMREWLTAQRVSGVATELATDVRYALSEAISGNSDAGIVFNNAGNGCYTVYRATKSAVRGGCDCTRPSGTVCDATWTELKTVVLPVGGDIFLSVPGEVKEAYGAGSKLLDGGAGIGVEIKGGGARQLLVRTTSGLHHPTICKPASSTIPGFKPCE